MKIEIIKCLKDNYSYLVIDETTKIACVIDPSEAKPIIDVVEQKKINLKYILNTHHHYDHIGGNSELKKKYKAKVVGFNEDYKRIPGIDTKLKDGETWKEDIILKKKCYIYQVTLLDIFVSIFTMIIICSLAILCFH